MIASGYTDKVRRAFHRRPWGWPALDRRDCRTRSRQLSKTEKPFSGRQDGTIDDVLSSIVYRLFTIHTPVKISPIAAA